VCAGAEILVAGSAIFEHGDPRANARQLLNSALDAAKQPAQGLSSVVGAGAPGNAGN
jgi:hypothetical protein